MDATANLGVLYQQQDDLMKGTDADQHACEASAGHAALCGTDALLSCPDALIFFLALTATSEKKENNPVSRAHTSEPSSRPLHFPCAASVSVCLCVYVCVCCVCVCVCDMGGFPLIAESLFCVVFY